MNSADTVKTADSTIAATYKRFPMVFSKGREATRTSGHGRKDGREDIKGDRKFR